MDTQSSNEKNNRKQHFIDLSLQRGRTRIGLYLARNASANETTMVGVDPMPHNATNMPFPRTTSYRDSKPSVEATSISKEDITLKAENILLEEFSHASITAYQAKEDRERIFNLYLLSFGILATALIGLTNISDPTAAFSVGLAELAIQVMAGVLNFVFLSKFLNISREYRESLSSMNTIKGFYIQRFQTQIPQFEKILGWSQKSPTPTKFFNNIISHTAYPIAVVGSILTASTIMTITYIPYLWAKNIAITIPPWTSTLLVYYSRLGLSVAVALLLLLWLLSYIRKWRSEVSSTEPTIPI